MESAQIRITFVFTAEEMKSATLYSKVNRNG